MSFQIGSKVAGGRLLGTVQGFVEPKMTELAIIGFNLSDKISFNSHRKYLENISHRVSTWRLPSSNEISIIRNNIFAGILPYKDLLPDGIYWTSDHVSERKASTTIVEVNKALTNKLESRTSYCYILPVKTISMFKLEADLYKDELTNFLDTELDQLNTNLITKVAAVGVHKLKVTFLDKEYTLEVTEVNKVSIPKKTIKPKVVPLGPELYEQFSCIPGVSLC